MTALENSESSVAVYANHQEAENAVKVLQHGGFDMKKLSIIASNYKSEEHIFGYYTTENRMTTWGKYGAFWGAIWGLFLGTGLFFIPGIGPILAGGPIVAAIVSILEGAVAFGGISAIAAGLVSMGIPKESALKYETELKAGKFLIVAYGLPQDTEKAKKILVQAGLKSPESHSKIPSLA